MSFVVLDTDAVSLVQKRRLPDELSRNLVGITVCLTFVTLAELHKWTEIRSWGARSRQALEDWLHHVVILPYGEQVCRMWARSRPELSSVAVVGQPTTLG